MIDRQCDLDDYLTLPNNEPKNIGWVNIYHPKVYTRDNNMLSLEMLLSQHQPTFNSKGEDKNDNMNIWLDNLVSETSRNATSIECWLAVSN